MPIIQGEQGTGKSTFVEHLTPEPSFFREGVSFHYREKELIESILGAVHVEFGEIAGLRRSNIDRLKAFITRRNDSNIRLAFERRPDSLMRRCIFVGTTNSVRPLPNDISGNRRFLVVVIRGTLGTTGIRNWLTVNRNFLWAEALFMYHQGEKIYLDDEQEELQSHINLQFRDADLAVEDTLRSTHWRRNSYSMQEVMLFSGLISSKNKVVDQELYSRVMRALLMLGWEQIKGGKWQPPMTRC